MSDRRERERRQERRERAAKPSAAVKANPAHGVASPPSNRGTFAVARANRVLAETLPGVIYQKSSAPKARVSAPVLQSATVEPVARPDRSRTVAAKPRPSANHPGQKLTLDRPKTCKARPDNRQRSNNPGGSRDFIPHCDR